MLQAEDISSILPAMTTKGEIVLYQPNDQLKIEVRLDNETVWLTQQQMAILFDVKENNITYHIQGIYKTHELEQDATTQKIRVVRKEGNRQVSRSIDFYNLDMIISVGYRVNSANATQFRRWATSVLKEYLLNGYAVNQRLIAMEERIDRRLAQHDSILQKHQEKIDFFVQANLPPVEKVFFDGDFFEARVLLEKLVKTARHRIIVVDAYIDAATFDMLDVREKGVTADIYSGKDLSSLRDMHNASAETNPINTHIWSNPSHDRWLIIDDFLYHCGHSLKDMGRKLSAITLMGTSPEKILDSVK
ncbi:MAG: virulence RhuM family protein [Bacteroidales bacterium]|nr:virulence RhuM family protein [Bacteroidales bacterium]